MSSIFRAEQTKKRTMESRDSVVLISCMPIFPIRSEPFRRQEGPDQAAEAILLTLLVRREILREAAFL